MTDPTRYISFLYLAEDGDGGKSPFSAKVQGCTSVSTCLLKRERGPIAFSGFGPAYISLPVLQLGPRFSTLQPRVRHGEEKGDIQKRRHLQGHTGEGTHIHTQRGDTHTHTKRGHTRRGYYIGRILHEEGEMDTRRGNLNEEPRTNTKTERGLHRGGTTLHGEGTMERGLHREGRGDTYGEETTRPKGGDTYESTDLFYFILFSD